MVPLSNANFQQYEHLNIIEGASHANTSYLKTNSDVITQDDITENGLLERNTTTIDPMNIEENYLKVSNNDGKVSELVGSPVDLELKKK